MCMKNHWTTCDCQNKLPLQKDHQWYVCIIDQKSKEQFYYCFQPLMRSLYVKVRYKCPSNRKCCMFEGVSGS